MWLEAEFALGEKGKGGLGAWRGHTGWWYNIMQIFFLLQDFNTTLLQGFSEGFAQHKLMTRSLHILEVYEMH